MCGAAGKLSGGGKGRLALKDDVPHFGVASPVSLVVRKSGGIFRAVTRDLENFGQRDLLVL